MSTKPVTEDKKIKVPVKQRAASFCPPLKYKIISDEHINLTKAKAYAFLELKKFEGERDVRERHVQFLFDEWSANRFLWQNVIIASAKIEGKEEEYRINGQHTCWMRVNVPERYEPVDCKTRVMCYSVQDEEHLRTLYSVFDRGAPRAVGHVGKVLLLGSEATNGIPQSLISQLITGFRMYWGDNTRNSKTSTLTINDVCGLIDNNYKEIFNAVGKFLVTHAQAEGLGFMKRGAVIASLMFTFEKRVEAAIEFWTPVADGVNLPTKTDARYQLRNYLLTHGHSIKSGQEKVSQEEMLCVCLNLWNHWRKGESVTTVKTPSERPTVKS